MAKNAPVNQLENVDAIVYADSNKVFLYDSLMQYYLNRADTFNQTLVLNQKAQYYIHTNQASKAIAILDPLLSHPNTQTTAPLVGKLHFNLGFAYVENYQYYKSFPHFEAAYEWAHTNQDSLLCARSLHFLGIAEYFKGNNTIAFRKMYEAHILLNKLNDHEFLLHSCNDLGILFLGLKNYKQAKKYLKLSLKYDTLNHPSIKSYRPIIFTNFGVLYLSDRENYDSSVFYNNLALEEMGSTISWTDQFSAINNLHVIEIKTGQYDAAYQYFSKAYRNNEIKTIPYYYSNIVINYSIVLYKLKQFELAYQISKQAAELAKENRIAEFNFKALKNIYKIDSLRGDYQKALLHFQLMTEAKKQIDANEIELELTRIKVNAEIEKINKNYQQLVTENLVSQSKINRLKKVSIGQWILITIFMILSVFLIKTLINNKKLLNQLNQSNIDQSKTNRLLEAQAQKIEIENKNKDRLLSLLSHDLRSPLGNLNGILNLIIDSWGELDDLQKLKLIKKLNIQTQNTLINVEETLDWVLLNRKKVNPSIQSINLNKIFKKLELDHLPLAENKKIQLIFENTIESDVNTDPEILDHILHNLLTNAIKFTPHAGKISVSSFLHKNYIHIQVKDSGIGIPKDQIAQLFSENHHYNRKGTAGENSTGLGLSIVKKFSALIQGKIEVESVNGLGSTFTLVLPIVKI
jgi:signal transduction histidine kinase